MIRLVLTILLTQVLAATAFAAPMALEQVPQPLKPWVDWALHGHPDRHCPMLYRDDTRACVWPGELTVASQADGATFTQQLVVYRKTQFVLPGDAKNWPVDVKLNDKRISVVARDDRPSLILTAGVHKIAGRFAWQTMPVSLQLNPETGIVSYRRGDADIKLPDIRDGKLWLRSDRPAASSKAPEDAISVRVNRLLSDGHPFELMTQMVVDVSGRQRELTLGVATTDGFIPMRIKSKLPARLENDGTMRVQVRPGRWTIWLRSRAPGAVTKVTSREQEAPWPSDEVWVFKAAPAERTVDVSGAAQIDPRQLTLPKTWQNLPSYLMLAGKSLDFKTVRRGDPQPAPDNLRLSRDIWLDFDGKGMTLQDRLRGTMTHDWRLSAERRLNLGRATLQGQGQFITRLNGDTRNGVEVRRGQIDLLALSRLSGGIHDIPATGWGRNFQKVDAKLHLPPGWQLLAVSGADHVPSTWLQQWSMYDLFLILVITLAVFRLWRSLWAGVALLTLVLTWHEPNSPQLIWVFTLVFAALLRYVPAATKFFWLIRFARVLTLLVLVVTVVPFFVQQVREGIHPQLERHGRSVDVRTRSPKRANRDQMQERAMSVQSAVRSGQKLKRLARKHSANTLPRSVDFNTNSVKKSLPQIDPKAIVQTGPGLPEWRWQTHRLNWSGPVAKDQKIELYLLGPQAHFWLNLLMVLLVSLLVWRVLDSKKRPPGGKWRGDVWIAAVLAASSSHSSAQNKAPMPEPTPPPAVVQSVQLLPTTEMLILLGQRLTEPDTLAPRADISNATFELRGDRFTASLQVHALERTALPLPLDVSVLTPVKVLIDDEETPHALMRTGDGHLWALVPAGRHQVIVHALVPQLDQLQIPLMLAPRHAQVSAPGWSVSGLDNNGVPTQQISLVRVKKATKSDKTDWHGSVLPPFLIVQRTIRMGLEWVVDTEVRRRTPSDSALSVLVPIVPGGKVISAGVKVKDGAVQVSMAANQRVVRWRSRLKPTDRFSLTASDDPRWLEVWKAEIGPIWHTKIDGLVPIHHQGPSKHWSPTWHPWPGESIQFHVSRPVGAPGKTATFHKSMLEITPGNRVSDSRLNFSVQSSRAYQHALKLPDGAQVLGLKVDGKSQPVRLVKGRVALPIQPGEHRFELRWREQRGQGVNWQSADFLLNKQHVNARIKVKVSKDRWTLWLSGPDMGPAVLFWGVVFVILLLAVVMSKGWSGSLPLGWLSWLLLGIGLAQSAAWAILLMIAWFLLLHYRRAMSLSTRKWVFNVTQVAIVVMTVLVFAIFISVIPQGLLGAPDMQIAGNGSSAWQFNWYQDRVTGNYPQVSILSVPLWVYRGLMLLWALWLAYSLLNWIKWGWQSFSQETLWRSFHFRRNKAAATGSDAARDHVDPPDEQP